MRILFSVFLIVLPLLSFSEEFFEINQKNCNLPIKEIRKLLPDKEQRLQAFKACLQKANDEEWTRNKLVKQPK